jgi:hypothetical protein
MFFRFQSYQYKPNHKELNMRQQVEKEAIRSHLNDTREATHNRTFRLMAALGFDLAAISAADETGRRNAGRYVSLSPLVAGDQGIKGLSHG